MPKKQTDKLSEVVNLIIANSKDAKYGEKLARRVIDIQKQLDNKAVEIHVPISTITDEIDFDSTKIQRCAQGFLFTAKGGLQTLVSWRMNAVCEMIDAIFKFRDQPTEDKEELSFRELYTAAIQYVFQAPLFSSLGQQALFEIATKILETFRTNAEEKIDSATPSEETEEDVKANIEAEREEEFLNNMVKEAENLPNYEDE
jgi:hypothetical protein